MHQAGSVLEISEDVEWRGCNQDQATVGKIEQTLTNKSFADLGTNNGINGERTNEHWYIPGWGSDYMTFHSQRIDVDGQCHGFLP